MSDSAGRDLALGAAQAARGGALLKFGIIAVLVVLVGVILLGAISGGGGHGTTTAAGSTDPRTGQLPQPGTGADLAASQGDLAQHADDVATELDVPAPAVLLILMHAQ